MEKNKIEVYTYCLPDLNKEKNKVMYVFIKAFEK